MVAHPEAELEGLLGTGLGLYIILTINVVCTLTGFGNLELDKCVFL